MTEKQMWEAYTSEHPDKRDEVYEAWCYGSDIPDVLAELTLSGVKTATASAYPCYEYEKCELPKAGEHSIILDTKGNAVCVILTTRVTVVPFAEVTEEQAFREGEGDRSLEYWREVHKKAFTDELAEIDGMFSENMLVVCEEFEMVFPSKRVSE